MCLSSGSKDLLENDGVHVLGNHWIVCFHPNLTGTGWCETTDFKVKNALGWSASIKLWMINFYLQVSYYDLELTVSCVPKRIQHSQDELCQCWLLASQSWRAIKLCQLCTHDNCQRCHNLMRPSHVWLCQLPRHVL